MTILRYMAAHFHAVHITAMAGLSDKEKHLLVIPSQNGELMSVR